MSEITSNTVDLFDEVETAFRAMRVRGRPLDGPVQSVVRAMLGRGLQASMGTLIQLAKLLPTSEEKAVVLPSGVRAWSTGEHDGFISALVLRMPAGHTHTIAVDRSGRPDAAFDDLIAYRRKIVVRPAPAGPGAPRAIAVCSASGGSAPRIQEAIHEALGRGGRGTRASARCSADIPGGKGVRTRWIEERAEGEGLDDWRSLFRAIGDLAEMRGLGTGLAADAAEVCARNFKTYGGDLAHRDVALELGRRLAALDGGIPGRLAETGLRRLVGLAVEADIPRIGKAIASIYRDMTDRGHTSEASAYVHDDGKRSTYAWDADDQRSILVLRAPERDLVIGLEFNQKGRVTGIDIHLCGAGYPMWIAKREEAGDVSATIAPRSFSIPMAVEAAWRGETEPTLLARISVASGRIVLMHAPGTEVASIEAWGSALTDSLRTTAFLSEEPMPRPDTPAMQMA